MLNILDASSPGDAVSPGAVAGVLAAVTAKQCGPAGGKCGGEAQVRVGPPPLGGDQPGFLAAGDLPPVASSVSPWNAAPIELPQEDFVGASCENVNWTTVDAESRSSRVYLHPDSGTSYFGVNQIILILKDEKAAKALVEKIKTNLEECKERRLTATVSDPKKVGGARREGHRDHRLHRHCRAEGHPGLRRVPGRHRAGRHQGRVHLRQPQGRLRLHRLPVEHHLRTGGRTGHPGPLT